MTICQALLWARGQLTPQNPVGGQTFALLQGFEVDSVNLVNLDAEASFDLDTEVIMSYVLGKSREWILANQKLSITNFQLSKYKRLIKQRAKGVPVAYLTNKKEFFGLDFYVDERVLVPRPETEMLVTEVLTYLRKCLRKRLRKQKITIIDVGTGSGCVGVAIAHALKARFANLAFRGDANLTFKVEVYGTDISKDALVVARKNARKHGVDVKFLQGDLLEPVSTKRTHRLRSAELRRYVRFWDCGRWPDIIVANLPYLKPGQIKGDIEWEPKVALEGGHDGLKYYERLLKQMENALPAGRQGKCQPKAGQPLAEKMENCVFEIDPGQTIAIKKLIKKYLPCGKISVKKDLAGRDRVVVVGF